MDRKKYFCYNCNTMQIPGEMYSKMGKEWILIDDVNWCQVCGSPEIRVVPVDDELLKGLYQKK